MSKLDLATYTANVCIEYAGSVSVILVCLCIQGCRGPGKAVVEAAIWLHCAFCFEYNMKVV